MGRVIVRWGKSRLELPSELLLFVLIEIFLALHSVNVLRVRNNPGVVPPTPDYEEIIAFRPTGILITFSREPGLSG